MRTKQGKQQLTFLGLKWPALALSVLTSAVLMSSGCSDKKNNDDGCQGSGCGGMPMGGGQNNNNGGQQTPEGVASANTIKADFGGATGALVLDPTTAASLGLALTDSGAEGENSFVKLKDDGEIAPILGIEKNDTSFGGPNNSLPKIKTIAVSPIKEIFLHFERPFLYKSQTEPRYLTRAECAKFAPGATPPAPGPDGKTEQAPPICFQKGLDNPKWKDPWDMSSGFQCQIFKVSGGKIDDLIANGAAGTAESNLECLDNQHFINEWQTTRNSVFQFDRDGNVFYPGSLPAGGGRMVVYRHGVDGSVTEMINSNICVQDFLVTINGGLFYTGSTSCGSGGGSGGGFFRYVAPAGGQLREIARDWWNFVFEAIEGVEIDQAVFFGPDPRSATTASWNSACLFRYDPAAGTSAQETITGLISCGDDINGWLDMSRKVDTDTYGRGFNEPNRMPSAAWKTEYQRRCAIDGQVFAGGGSQISAIKQDSNGKVYVIGQVRKKKAGVISCNVQVKGAHCADKSGAPHLPSEAKYGTRSECLDIGGTWNAGNDGNCEVVFNNSGTRTTRDLNRASVEICLQTKLTDPDITALSQPGTVESVHWVNHRQTDYNNVVSPICTLDDANRVTNIWDWNITAESYHNGGTGAGGAVEEGDIIDGTAKYSSDWWHCNPADATSANDNNWLVEYKGLAEVDPATKSLVLRSTVDEQAIQLWLVNDIPYYSAYNTAQGRYYLKRYNPTVAQTQTIAANFETYNLSEGDDPSLLYYDGLNFETNEYSFGTINSSTYAFTKKVGLTGQVKMIVVLPKN